MSERKFGHSKFLVMGAAYWIAVAALLVLAGNLWPDLQDSRPFFYAAVLGATVGGFAIVYLFRPK